MAVKVKRIVQTGRFRATDERGECHTLHVFASSIEDGPHAGRLEVRSVRTEDGESLERVGRGEYRTEWGEAFRSDDPDAP
jgi:hypothetical protein